MGHGRFDRAAAACGRGAVVLLVSGGLAQGQIVMQPPGAPGQEVRTQSLLVSVADVQSERTTTAGQRILDDSFPGFSDRSCARTSSHTDPTFSSNEWTAQAGFAQNEIFAASYTLDASDFPLRIDSVQGLFVTAATIETTTTEYTVFVWQGTPSTGSLVFSASSDGLTLPHLVMPPGNNATLVEIMVDPGDPNQIVVQDNGSRTFSIGFRIDKHNSQTQNPCFFGPPSNRNAFPATDTDGLSRPSQNWLFAVDCGAFGCRAGWSTFSQLGLCTPSGDWALAANWTPLSCTPGIGACCLPDGSCSVGSTQACSGAGGTYQGDGTSCDGADCPVLPQACCFESTGGCLNLTPANCAAAGGFSGGVGTICQAFTCFPVGACCLPDGSCEPNLSPGDCAGIGGTFLGDGTTCQIGCPEPEGACCFATGGCLTLIESDCAVAGGSFAGAGTTCADTNGNGTPDACESVCVPDFAEPFGVLDIFDVLEFLSLFEQEDPRADLAPPLGVFDIFDVLEFLDLFSQGCP